MADPGVDGDVKGPVILAILFALFRFPLTVALELSPDEAYYWLWSERLDLSYFDHPPIVAWWIRLSTAVFGRSEAAIRLPAIACGIVVPVAAAYAARILSPPSRRDTAGLATALIVCAMPLMHAGSVVITPDSPAAAAWAVALAAVAAALAGRTGAWYVAGLAIGIGLLAKYTVIAFVASIGLFLLADREARAHLRTVHPWAALALGGLLFAPVVVWNAGHDWVSFRFQLDHGAGAGRGGGLAALAEYLLAQLLLVTPMVAILVVRHIRQGGVAASRQGDRLLAFSVVPTFLLFAVTSLRSPAEANWPAFAYLGAAVIAGLSLARAREGEGGRSVAALYRSAVVVGVAASILLSVHAVQPLVRIKRDRLKREFHGWSALAAAVDAEAGPDVAVFADSYRTAAELAYYGAPRAAVGVLRRKRSRASMFDLWPAPEIAPGGDAVYVGSRRRRKVPSAWRPRFAAVESRTLPPGVRGTLWRLRGYQATEGAP